MSERDRKETRKVARALPRLGAGLLASIDNFGGRVVEAVAGVWLGLAVAALVTSGATADIGRYLKGEGLMPAPKLLCTPLTGQGPYLDGDVVAIGLDSPLVCNGYSGHWETPDERDERLAQMTGSAVYPMQ